MPEPHSARQCPDCGYEFSNISVRQIHYERGCHNPKAGPHEPMVVDGGIAKDPQQNIYDAQRTVDSAETTLRRARTGVRRFRLVLAMLVVLGILGAGLIFTAGLVADLGLGNTAEGMRTLGIPLLVVSFLASAFWTVASYDRKVFENRDVAEQRTDEAQEQYTRVVATLPEPAYQARLATQSEVQQRLQLLADNARQEA